MDALDFLDDTYGVCVVPVDSGRWVVSFILIGLLAVLLIKKTESDLKQMRRVYLAQDDVD